MQQLPEYIAIVFGMVSLATLILFGRVLIKGAGSAGKWIVGVLVIWLIAQAALSLNGFFTDSSAVPPRLVFAVGPPFLAIIFVFATRGGRRFLDGLPLAALTWVNAVRVAVEVVLYWLAIYKVLPEEMTFTGRNFDVLVGLSAPFIAYFGLARQQIGRRVILAWNVVALCILLNVVIHGLLSIPSPFQQLTFDHPNVALMYFPFNWLPAFVVPVALFTHLVSIRQLTLSGERAKGPKQTHALSAVPVE